MAIPADDESHYPFLENVIGQYASNNDTDLDVIVTWDSQKQDWLAHYPAPGPPVEDMQPSPPLYEIITRPRAQIAPGTEVQTPPDASASPPGYTRNAPAYESIAGAQAQILSGTEVQTARDAFANPSRYVGPSLRPGLHPYYSASDSFDYAPPPSAPAALPSHSLFSWRSGSSSQLQVSAAPPLPSCFSRPPPANLSYDEFPPTYLIANGKNFDAGFPTLPPLSSTQPHPFTSHDVSEADWSRFLGDLQRATTLSATSQQADAGGVCIFTSLLGGRKASNEKQAMTKDSTKFVIELINIWNKYFFYHRQLEVILARGHVRLDCSHHASLPSLNAQIEQMAPCLTRTSSVSSSSLISDDNSTSCGIPKHEKRASRLAIPGTDSAEKWGEVAEKRSRSPSRGYDHKEKGKAGASGGDDKLFRLFVIYRLSNIHDCYGVSNYIL